VTVFSQPASAGTFAACLPPHLRKPRLRRVEGSEYLELMHSIRLATATLAKLACTGGGGILEFDGSYSREEAEKMAAAHVRTMRSRRD
jgi:hypothetical protein